MKRRIIESTIVVLGILVLIFIVNSVVSLRALFYLPSLLFLCIGFLVVVLATGSYSKFVDGFRIARKQEYSYTEKSNIKDIKRVYNILTKATLLLVSIELMISFIGLLGNLSNPAEIGPLIALGLLSIFYGSILILNLLIIKYRIGTAAIRKDSK